MISDICDRIYISNSDWKEKEQLIDEDELIPEEFIALLKYFTHNKKFIFFLDDKAKEILNSLRTIDKK